MVIRLIINRDGISVPDSANVRIGGEPIRLPVNSDRCNVNARRIMRPTMVAQGQDSDLAYLIDKSQPRS